MTVKELKEMLKDLDDDARIYSVVVEGYNDGIRRIQEMYVYFERRKDWDGTELNSYIMYGDY